MAAVHLRLVIFRRDEQRLFKAHVLLFPVSINRHPREVVSCLSTAVICDSAQVIYLLLDLLDLALRVSCVLITVLSPLLELDHLLPELVVFPLVISHLPFLAFRARSLDYFIKILVTILCRLYVFSEDMVESLVFLCATCDIPLLVLKLGLDECKRSSLLLADVKMIF